VCYVEFCTSLCKQRDFQGHLSIDQSTGAKSLHTHSEVCKAVHMELRPQRDGGDSLLCKILFTATQFSTLVTFSLCQIIAPPIIDWSLVIVNNIDITWKQAICWTGH